MANTLTGLVKMKQPVSGYMVQNLIYRQSYATLSKNNA